jgi:beta-lactamase class A
MPEKRVIRRSIRTLLACLAGLPVAAGAGPAVGSSDAPTPLLIPVTDAVSGYPKALRVDPSTRDPADLWASTDARLQQGLDELVKAHGLEAAARDGRLAIALADVTDPGAPRVAAINGDKMMYAASLPKIAILLGAMDKIQGGAATTASLDEDIEQMIRYSSNSAATRVLQWVGRDHLISLLQSPRLRLYDAAHNGGLWVGKDYGGNPAYHRDPLHNLSHGATAMQVARLFQLLESGSLLDPQLTARMKATLGDPGIHHKFVKGLESRPDAKIFRKSGTWRDFHADGALVESGGRRLVLVGLAEDPHGGDWLASIAAPMHDLALATPPAPTPARAAAVRVTH